MTPDMNGVDRTIFEALYFNDNSGWLKISLIKWMKILATIQSLRMQIYGVVVKKISKKESKWWPQNVQCQL